MISFCIRVLDRIDDLQKTLSVNMGANLDAEFVVLDYGSTDDVLRWIGHELHRLPPVRRFAVHRLKKPRAFNHAHSKNLAHRLATGEVLVNLDADNFTGEGYSEEILQLLDRNGLYATTLDVNPPVTSMPPFAIMPLGRLKVAEEFGGAGGRIVVSRSAFHLVRGYDETFNGFGFEDTEFLARLRNAGVQMVEMYKPEALHNITTSTENKNAPFSGDMYKQFNSNRDKYLRVVVNNTAVANRGVDYGAGETELVYLLED